MEIDDFSIKDIINAVAEEVGVDPDGMFRGTKAKNINARLLLCFLVDNTFTLLRSKLSFRMCCNLIEISARSEKALYKAYDDSVFERHLGNIYRKLGVPEVDVHQIIEERMKKENVRMAEDGSAIHYKSPLGFVYSELEEIKYQRAIREAAIFMQSYGKGVEPLMDGYATKRGSNAK